MPWLLVNPGLPEAWKIQLKPGANTFGRNSTNDFPLEDSSVSGSHCEIVVEAGGAVLRDLGSTNGTFVDRARVQEAALQGGQTLHFGTLRLVFYADAPHGTSGVRPSPGAAARDEKGEAALADASALAIAAAPGDGRAPWAAASVAPARVAVSAAPIARSSSPPIGPAPVPLPPVMVSADPDAAETQVCKYHPKTPARFQCPQCQRLFCELCVNVRVQHHVCRSCGVDCTPVQVLIKLAPPPKGFYARLPGAFLFPFRGSGVLVLIVGTFLLAMFKAGGGMGGLGPKGGSSPGFSSGLSFGWWGLMARVVILGYLFTYMQNIIHSTAIDDKELPTLPDITNFWDDILLPCLQLIGVSLISFAPAIGVECWAIATGQEGLGPALTSALVLGGLYFPMAFLSLAMLDSVAAANPLQVIPSILRVPREYLVAVVVLGCVFGIRTLGDVAIEALFPKGLATHSITKLLEMFAAQAFWGLVSLYMLTVGMRVLGLLYVSRQEKLHWYGR
jgi:FHA domain